MCKEEDLFNFMFTSTVGQVRGHFFVDSNVAIDNCCSRAPLVPTPASFSPSQTDMTVGYHCPTVDVFQLSGALAVCRSTVLAQNLLKVEVKAEAVESSVVGSLMRLSVGKSLLTLDDSWVLPPHKLELCFPTLSAPTRWMEVLLKCKTVETIATWTGDLLSSINGLNHTAAYWWVMLSTIAADWHGWVWLRWTSEGIVAVGKDLFFCWEDVVVTCCRAACSLSSPATVS